ncbi:MAG: hypothetical protein A2X49_07775 [Lentisphaerae bacterium GWF2_52_8]|nr:MAG: hypothetical protein A2X49_07775 [Lentisphaerae bacterium GWF2_52_8]
MQIRLKDYIKDGFPLALMPVSDSTEFPVHSHDYVELVLVLDGTGVHLAEGREYVISSGDVFVINENFKHGYRNAKKLKIVNILFDLKALSAPLYDLRLIPGFLSLFELEPRFRVKHEFKSRLRLRQKDIFRAKQLAFDIHRELSERSPGYKAICVGLFLELLVFLSRTYSKAPTPERDTLCNFSRVISFIESRFAEDISLGQLARLAKMSRRNFQRAFMAATGSSPINYLLNLRMAKAAELLVGDASTPVSEIALRIGFCDSNYFARQFRKIMKMSPREYRDSQRR